MSPRATTASCGTDELDGDDDAWCPQVVPEASLRRARMVAAINASADPRAGRGALADAIRERAFATMSAQEQVRGVIVQFVTCARRGPRVRLRAWLDTGSIVTIERDQNESATPVALAAALVVAVERETSLQETALARRDLLAGLPAPR